MSAKILSVTVLDEAAEEALLVIGDGHYSCEAYCQPCSAQIGQLLQRPLMVFSAERIVRQEPVAPIGFSKTAGPFGWLACGQVIDCSNRLVVVGEIRIKLDVPLPGDVANGDIISFSSARLDFIA